jgi:serine/threonine-protein kinase
LGQARAHASVYDQVAGEQEEQVRKKEVILAELKKQIEDLRAQLRRYSEALEADLQAGRERIASRVQEAINYEKSFRNASETIIEHLNDKPECSEILRAISRRPRSKQQQQDEEPTTEALLRPAI